ncbi:MAG: hypothetical protein M1829_002771 [Trizodia sp. TS-e1964]|nr:MAG: hypothetical protein M1829_002771 [Trizodia sp. TS-e1964]
MLRRKLVVAQLPRFLPRCQVRHQSQLDYEVRYPSKTEYSVRLEEPEEGEEEDEDTDPEEKVYRAKIFSHPEVQDPNMNGGYINPPAIKRQFRDPYGDWWDKQERRNFGEPVHEDNDILGIFALHEYTHFKPAMGFFLVGCFVSSILGLSYGVSKIYADKPSYPREFEGGLMAELGGPGALRARMAGDPFP